MADPEVKVPDVIFEIIVTGEISHKEALYFGMKNCQRTSFSTDNYELCVSRETHICFASLFPISRDVQI